MFKPIARLVACLTLITASVHAQTGAAQLQGTVSDSTGAVVPNAAVALSNPQTGGKFETTTNGTGVYIFPSIQAGDYKLNVSAAGLQKWEANATLRAGQE